MRAGRIEVLHAQHSEPLVVRARIEKSFLGLGLFSAITILLYGIYLLTKALLNPLQATEITVLGAGFTISLATFAITYILWPRSRSALAREEDASHERSDGPVLTVLNDGRHIRVQTRQALAERRNLPGPM